MLFVDWKVLIKLVRLWHLLRGKSVNVESASAESEKILSEIRELKKLALSFCT